MIFKYHLQPPWDNFAKEKDYTFIIKVMEYHFTHYHFFCNNPLYECKKKLYALQIFLLPKVQILPASHHPLYFHCPFDSQQMLVVSHCTLTVHQNVFLLLQFLPFILTFLLKKRLQLITCQKYIL